MAKETNEFRREIAALVAHANRGHFTDANDVKESVRTIARSYGVSTHKVYNAMSKMINPEVTHG